MWWFVSRLLQKIGSTKFDEGFDVDIETKFLGATCPYCWRCYEQRIGTNVGIANRWRLSNQTLRTIWIIWYCSIVDNSPEFSSVMQVRQRIKVVMDCERIVHYVVEMEPLLYSRHRHMIIFPEDAENNKNCKNKHEYALPRLQSLRRNWLHQIERWIDVSIFWALVITSKFENEQDQNEPAPAHMCIRYIIPFSSNVSSDLYTGTNGLAPASSLSGEPNVSFKQAIGRKFSAIKLWGIIFSRVD